MAAHAVLVVRAGDVREALLFVADGRAAVPALPCIVLELLAHDPAFLVLMRHVPGIWSVLHLCSVPVITLRSHTYLAAHAVLVVRIGDVREAFLFVDDVRAAEPARPCFVLELPADDLAFLVLMRYVPGIWCALHLCGVPLILLRSHTYLIFHITVM